MDNDQTKERNKSFLRRRVIGPETPAPEEENEADLDEQLRAHRLRKWIIILVLLAIVAAAGVYLYNRHKNRVFSESEVLEEVDVPGVSGASFVQYLSGALKVTGDGVSYLGDKGQTVWSTAYSMKDPMASVAGPYAAVADRMGRDLVICSEKGIFGQARTTLPITRISVSQNGIAAVVMEDAKASYVEIYASDGSRLDIEIKALLTQSGYPMDVAISPNGQILAVAYVYFDQGLMKNQVVFYNFDEEGKEYVDRVVGGFKEYEEVMIGDVVFLSNQAAVVFATDRVDFYNLRRSNEPSLRASVPIGQEISGVAYGHSRVAVLTKNAGTPGLVTVYNTSGDEVFTYEPTYTPEKMELTDRGLILYGGQHLTVLRENGKVRYNGTLSGGSAHIVQTAEDTYLQISEVGLRRIRLK
ncbi:MAG: hypothetical protein IJL66_08525 [Lachnospiraceae bacterium]|nr:hypothetical protein [Lachnospiraceae bacterium]